MEFHEKELLRDKSLLIYSIVTFVIFLTLLILQKVLDLSPATIALAAAVMLLFKAKRLNFEQFIANEIYWSTILFFIGLFIMVGALEETKFIELFSDKIIILTGGSERLLSVFIIWVTGVVAAFIDNVPYVTTMVPVVKEIGSAELIPGVWWAFVLGAVLSGNGSMIGSSANIISVSISKKSAHPISFWTFTKYSAIITVITFLFSTIYILVRY